jgi:hypothetical protein
LTCLVTANLPLLICMPLYCDVIHYDICAQNVLRGGVHYRDVFDVNLPGMVWLHVVIRWLFGWRVEPMRVIDALCVAGIIGLLASWFRASRGGKAAAGKSSYRMGWTVFALAAFYLSTSEWCHCQRDVWMMLPALGAFYLRRRQLADWTRTQVPKSAVVFRGLCEGFCWGAAFWLKPLIVVPAGICWLIAAVWMARYVAHPVTKIVMDLSLIILGAAFAGGLGIAWMVQSGTWPYFMDMVNNWLPYYYSAGPVYMLRSLWPWNLIHIVAVPLALVAILQGMILFAPPTSEKYLPGRLLQSLLAGLYLGWLIQARFLQQGWDYTFVPPILLGLTVLGGFGWPGQRYLSWALSFLVLGFAIVAAWHHPGIRPGRLALWARCIREGSAPQLRDRLSLETDRRGPTRLNNSRWSDLMKVADFLRKQHLRDGELTCYHMSTPPLYVELGLKPSTRFDYILNDFYMFPRCRATILDTLFRSRQRLLVSDAEAMKEFSPVLAYPMYLREEIFRSGRYAVHRVPDFAVQHSRIP